MVESRAAAVRESMAFGSRLYREKAETLYHGYLRRDPAPERDHEPWPADAACLAIWTRDQGGRLSSPAHLGW